MTTRMALLALCVLFVLGWPRALLALVLWPLAWLLLLPFRLVGITFAARFAFLYAVLTLPARLLGWRPTPAAQATARQAFSARPTGPGCLPGSRRVTGA